MSDENNTISITGNDESLTGDALLHAVRRDMLGLFELARALDQKVEARLHDTPPMWEAVVSRLDAIEAEQRNQGTRLEEVERRLDAIEGRLDAIERRLDAMEGRLNSIEVKLERFDVIETEVRQLRRRIERMIGELSHDVVEVRAAQHDLEDRLEKLEKTPA